MNSKYLAVFLPGIGYHNDKPLLYYSRKLALECGYDAVLVTYHDLPSKVKGNKEKMMEAVDMAYAQTVQSLNDIDMHAYEKIVFVGKSIGTVIASRFVAEYGLQAGLILYTPVEATFACNINSGIAFIGTADPWSNLEDVKGLAREQKVPLYLYEDVNHSLECNDQIKNIEILQDVMEKTKDYLTDTYRG